MTEVCALITVPELSSNSMDVIPGSSDQNQGKGAKDLQSFADLFASAKAAAGKPAGEPVVGQDKADAIGLPKQGVATTTSSTPSTESMPAEVAAPIETGSTPAVSQKAVVEENQNPRDSGPHAKTGAVQRTRGEAIKHFIEEPHDASSEKIAPEEKDASSIKLAESDGATSDSGKATGKEKGVHTKATHKLVSITPTAEMNAAPVQLSPPEPTSKTPMMVVDLHQSAVISAEVNTLSATQSVVGKNVVSNDMVSKDGPSTAPTARSSVAFATGVGSRTLPSLSGDEVIAVGPRDESREKTIDNRATAGEQNKATMDEEHKATADGLNKITTGEQSKSTTDDQHKVSSASIETPTPGQPMDAPGVVGFKDTQVLQQTISQPLTHSVAPATAKVSSPGGTDIPSPLRHVQSDSTTANSQGPIRILSERAIEVSVSDSQHGSVSVRAEMRNDGGVAALLLPQSEAGHQSLMSQTNGLSAFLSEHSPSVSVSVVAPTTSTGGNPSAGNSSGQPQSDGMQFAQHREERESQAQRSQSDEEFIYGANANHRAEERTWEIAQTSTTQQTGRPGWISIHV